ncbi:MAG: 50S ribosomal protein L25 [Candidatus Omnitrophica bacterium]|nr:50S ribosomal protein L25 [Candidatus Omnitrophota bacterium]
MEEIKLDVQVRNRIGSRQVKQIRRENFIPAIVYGDGGNPTSIKVERNTYERIMRHHRGQNVIFHLNVLEGEKKLRDYSVIVKEEQHDPVSDQLLHIDFNRISLTKEIEVKVAIAAKGEPVGVKRDGGSLEHVLWELPIICLPTKIPQKIEVEVSHLLIGDAVHLKDITLPEGVRTKVDPDTILVSVVPPMKEEVAVAAEEGPKEPEVLKEKKPAEGEAKEGEAKKEDKAESKAKEQKAKE